MSFAVAGEICLFVSERFFDERADFVVIAKPGVNENRAAIQRVRPGLALPIGPILQRGRLCIEHPLASGTDLADRAGACLRELVNQTMTGGRCFHASIVARMEWNFYKLFLPEQIFFQAITYSFVVIPIIRTLFYDWQE